MTKNIFNPTHKTGFFLDFFFNLSTIPLSSLNLGKFFIFVLETERVDHN